MQTQSNRVLLLYPPSKFQRHSNCPMGILMLAAVLEKHGFDVHILDANASRNKLTQEQIIQHVQEMKPAVIGMTLVTPLIREAYRLAQALKKQGHILLAGGPHATLVPEEPLAHGFDAVVKGEGEPIIVDAVKALVGEIPKENVIGWLYKDADNQVKDTGAKVMVQNIDDLPYPARHLVKPENYGPSSNPNLYGDLFSSRGCPARCAFCSGHLFGKNFRFRSAQSILDEISYIRDKYKTTYFHFMDDAMSVDRVRIEEMCEGIIRNEMDITWSMMTRVDKIDRKLLELAARAGCVQIDYGIESGHPETLKRIHKPHTVEMAKNAVIMTLEAGIKPYVFFILGFPWEDVAAIKATYNLIVELSPYVDNFHPAVASILVPFPGTEIYEKYKDEYGLENWWLSDKRNYDAPTNGTHSYYQSKVFRLGAVLDADFFNYSDQIKEKIYEVFRFMFLHNLKRRHWANRLFQRNLLLLSEKLHKFSPTLERTFFTPTKKVEALLKSLI